MCKENTQLDEKTRDLVQNALRGHEDAISALYQLYEQPLIAVIRGQLGLKLRGRLESRDLVQSMWKDVLDDMHDFKYQGAKSFFNWLVTRLIHKIQMKARYFSAGKRNVDRLFRIRGEDSSDLGVSMPSANDPTPSQEAIGNEQLDKLIRLLERFPETQRRIMIYRMRDNMSYDEIGKKLGKSKAAVSKMYARSIKRLYGYYLDDSNLMEGEA